MRRRDGGRWRSGLLAAFVFAMLVVPLAAAGPAARATGREAADPLPVSVLIDTLEPRVIRPGATLRITGRLTSSADQPLSDLRVRLRLRESPVGSRSELADLSHGTGPVGVVVPKTEAGVTGQLLPGTTTHFSVSVAVDDLHLGGFGVYLATVEARARVADGGLEPVARSRTFLPWVPNGSRAVPTRVAWLWPLAETPHRTASDSYLDDSLAASLADGGRLATLLDATAKVLTPAVPPATPAPAAAPTPAKVRPPPPVDPQRQVPLTWAIDPALLAAVADMADGYTVRAPGSAKPTTGQGADAAAGWLARLRAATHADGSVLALPYADPDLVALQRAGLGADITDAVRRGLGTTRNVLGVTPISDVAWPPGGFATAATLRQLVRSDVHAFVLSDRALPLTRDLGFTPGALTALPLPGAGGTTQALLSDSVLDGLLAGNPDPAAQPDLAAPQPTARMLEQRFLAETAMITAEHPSDGRAVVIAPPRRWNPSPRLAASLVADTGRVPWLAPVSLADVRAGGQVSDAPRAALDYPAGAASQELPGSYLTDPTSGVSVLRDRLQGFRSVLQPAGLELATAYDSAVLRTESSSWRDDLAGGARLRNLIADELDADEARVHIASRGLVTLTSRKGTIPVTLANDLDQPVTVRLQLTSRKSFRAYVDERALQHIDKHRKVTVAVQAEAVSAGVGVFPITVQLLTPSGQPFGPPVELRVRSTAYDSIALAITGSALGVLLVAVSVRLLRRGLRARRTRRGTP